MAAFFKSNEYSPIAEDPDTPKKHKSKGKSKDKEQRRREKLAKRRSNLPDATHLSFPPNTGVAFEHLGPKTVFKCKRLTKSTESHIKPSRPGSEVFLPHEAFVVVDINGLTCIPSDKTRDVEIFLYEEIQFFHYAHEPPVFQFLADVNGSVGVRVPFMVKTAENARIMHAVVVAYVNEKVARDKRDLPDTQADDLDMNVRGSRSFSGTPSGFYEENKNTSLPTTSKPPLLPPPPRASAKRRIRRTASANV